MQYTKGKKNREKLHKLGSCSVGLSRDSPEVLRRIFFRLLYLYPRVWRHSQLSLFLLRTPCAGTALSCFLVLLAGGGMAEAPLTAAAQEPKPGGFGDAP